MTDTEREGITVSDPMRTTSGYEAEMPPTMTDIRNLRDAEAALADEQAAHEVTAAAELALRRELAAKTEAQDVMLALFELALAVRHKPGFLVATLEFGLEYLVGNLDQFPVVAEQLCEWADARSVPLRNALAALTPEEPKP